MPCYEINLISVKFGGQSVALLEEIGARMDGRGLWQVKGVVIDVKAGTMRGSQEAINQVKRAYSQAAIRQAARRNGWTVTRKSENVFEAVKY